MGRVLRGGAGGEHVSVDEAVHEEQLHQVVHRRVGRRAHLTPASGPPPAPTIASGWILTARVLVAARPRAPRRPSCPPAPRLIHALHANQPPPPP